MSTIGYESWAVDLANVTAIYPFQGAEKFMVLLGVIFWIGFHVLQARMETKQFADDMKVTDKKRIDAAIDRY